MKKSSLLCVLALGGVALGVLSACGPTPANLANPTVPGDRSTISGDAKATSMQKTGTP